MKYFKRLGLYKNYNGNNQFNPRTLEAVSYGWWTYLRRLDNGLVVINNTYYSNSTSKHQMHLASLLRTLGIEVDIVVTKSTRSLDDIEGIIDDLKAYIRELQLEIAKPRSWHSTNERRQREINKTLSQIEILSKSLEKVG